MNERIKELAKAAEYWANTFEDKSRYQEYLMAAFAELIVRECADLFVDRRYMILNPHEPFANERVRALKEHDKDTVRKIREHFGVEE